MGLSRKSRFHLLRWIARIDWMQLRTGWFVTLTYPDELAAVQIAEATDQRTKFVRYAEKHLGEQLPILWRKELQTRKSGVHVGIGVPHWHLCVFTHKQLTNALVNEWWTKCLKATEFIQTDVQEMNDGQHAAFYLAKYLTQEKQSGILDDVPKLANPGRAWGWMRKNRLPLCPCELHVGIDMERWQRLMEQLRALRVDENGQEIESFTLIGPRADEAKKIIAEILS